MGERRKGCGYTPATNQWRGVFPTTLWRGRFYHYGGEIGVKNLFFGFFPSHRHSVARRRSTPMEEIGIDIIPNFVDMGSTELIL